MRRHVLKNDLLRESFSDLLVQKYDFEYIRILLNINYFDVPARLVLKSVCSIRGPRLY